jgi:hypothetical protein
MSCFIKKISNYEFREVYQCFPSKESMKDSFYQLGNYISQIITPRIVNFCKPYQEPVICPPINCTKCLLEQVIPPINDPFFNFEKNKFAIKAIAIGVVALPTIYFLGKKIINCFRPKVKKESFETNSKDRELITAAKEAKAQAAKDPFSILKIPNIFLMPKSALKEAATNSFVSFEIERGKIKTIINCRGLTAKRFERLLKELFETYSQVDHIEFDGLSQHHEDILSKLMLYIQINSITFQGSQNLEQKHLINLYKTLKINRFTFVDTPMAKIDELEENCIITYSDRTSNLEEKTSHFINDINDLFNPFDRARTPSVSEASELDSANQRVPKQITNAEIDQFITSLITKNYFSIFSSPDVFLDFSEIKNLNDKFLEKLLIFLKDNDLYISGMDLTENKEIEGSFLKEIGSLGIKTLNLSNTKINLENLKFLKNYPMLKNIDLSNLELEEKDLKELYFLKSLKTLNLNNCRKLPKDSLLKFIVTKLSSLEFISIEKTSLDGKEIDEISNYQTLNPMILVCEHKGERIINIKNANGIRGAIFHNLLKIKGNINQVVFSEGSKLSIQDIDKISRIPALINLKELNLSNVEIINFQGKDKTYNPLANLSNLRFRNLIFNPFKIQIEKNGDKTAERIDVQIIEVLTDDSLDFFIKYLNSFDKINEISFNKSNNLNKKILEEISKIASKVKLKLLDISNTNIQEDTLQKVDDEKPQDFLLELFKAIKIFNIEGLKTSQGGEIDEASFLAGINTATGSDSDAKNIRRANIFPNDKVEIVINSSRKKQQKVLILPLPESGGAASAAT